MKIATLVLLVDGNWILLGRKKKGEIGTRTLNGPGGKCEEGESLADCAIRETREEIGITLRKENLEEIATITFFAAGNPDFEVHVFRAQYEGTPQETADMTPEWHQLDNLPFKEMLESDREWFAKAARGETFRANVYYKERAKHFECIQFLPYS